MQSNLWKTTLLPRFGVVDKSILLPIHRFIASGSFWRAILAQGISFWTSAKRFSYSPRRLSFSSHTGQVEVDGKKCARLHLRVCAYHTSWCSVVFELNSCVVTWFKKVSKVCCSSSGLTNRVVPFIETGESAFLKHMINVNRNTTQRREWVLLPLWCNRYVNILIIHDFFEILQIPQSCCFPSCTASSYNEWFV